MIDIDDNPQQRIRLYGENNNILLSNEYFTPEDAAYEAADFERSKEIAEALNAQYPGHLWAVRVQGKQGIATIHNMALSHDYGYVIKLDAIYSSSMMRYKAIKAGGEILERFNVMRGRADDEAMDALPKDFAGRVLGDKSK